MIEEKIKKPKKSSQLVVEQLHWKHIIKDVNLQLNSGQFYAVVGANGAGKSSLLNLLSGTQAYDKGAIRLNDQRLTAFSLPELAKQRAVMPQKVDMAFAMKVQDIVALGAMSHTTSNTQEQAEQIQQCLDKVGLADFGGRNYQQLSGGEQQRVQLARVLMQLGPLDQAAGKWLFLDEATSSLDLQYQHQVFAIAKALAELGIGVFSIVHDVNLAAKYADQLICLDQGRIKTQGPVNETLTKALILDLYGLGSDLVFDSEDIAQLLINKTQVNWAMAS